MADLLECLLQISALRHTTNRLAEVTSDATPGCSIGAAKGESGVPAWLIAAEEELAAQLQDALPGGPALAPGSDFPHARPQNSPLAGEEMRLGRFFLLRRANLAILDRCSAEDLSQRVGQSGSASRTVADMVAIALARDTDALGALRNGFIADLDHGGFSHPRPT